MALPRHHTRARILVVGRPSELRIGRLITDGQDKYVVRDLGKRHGEPWAKLDNINLPDGGTWFRVADFAEALWYAGWHRGE